jgi:hypothetical protein
MKDKLKNLLIGADLRVFSSSDLRADIDHCESLIEQAKAEDERAILQRLYAHHNSLNFELEGRKARSAA